MDILSVGSRGKKEEGENYAETSGKLCIANQLTFRKSMSFKRIDMGTFSKPVALSQKRLQAPEAEEKKRLQARYALC